jgi:uncharacterized protein DUF5317
MFLLYAVIAGLFLGLIGGGRLTGLAELRFRWSAVMLAGLLVQVILFTDAIAERVGALGPPIYVASTAAVLVAVLRNLAIPGMAIVVAGAASNLAAIVANGGFMPVSPGALLALGKSPATIYSNSAVVADPALWFLTDIFALPSWLPFTNVFSVGDVLIAVGVAVAIVVAMRQTTAAIPAEPPPAAIPPPRVGAVRGDNSVERPV